MQTTAATRAASPRMGKKEVCDYLGKSPRTIAEYLAKGRLKCEYVSGPNGRQASFERADVERFKAEMETPEVRGQVTESSNAEPKGELAVREIDQMRVFAALLGIKAKEDQKPWLTLEESVSFSGLTRHWLLHAAESGTRGIRDMGRGARGGRWRFYRDWLRAGE